jgi:ankyrin repeat protein
MNNKLIFLVIATLLFTSKTLNAMEKKIKIAPAIKKKTFPSEPGKLRTLRDITERASIQSFKEGKNIAEGFPIIPIELREALIKKPLFFGTTLLHNETNIKNIKELLKEGIDPNIKNFDQQTPFNAHIAQGNLKVARKLLKLIGPNLDVSSPDIFGTNPLMNAIKKGYFDLVEKIIGVLAAQDKLYTVNSSNNAGQTALSLAIQIAPELIPILIHMGTADVNLVDDYTPLMVAARYNSEAIKPLIDAGADVNLANSEGTTPLMIAAEFHPESIIPLAILGANTEAQNNEHKTALIIASLKNPEAIKYLIYAKAQIDFMNSENKTALMIVSKLGKLKSVIELVHVGANINFVNPDGLSALTSAIQGKDNGKTVEFLIHEGALIREIDLKEAAQKPKKLKLLKNHLALLEYLEQFVK